MSFLNKYFLWGSGLPAIRCHQELVRRSLSTKRQYFPRITTSKPLEPLTTHQTCSQPLRTLWPSLVVGTHCHSLEESAAAHLVVWYQMGRQRSRTHCEGMGWASRGSSSNSRDNCSTISHEEQHSLVAAPSVLWHLREDLRSSRSFKNWRWFRTCVNLPTVVKDPTSPSLDGTTYPIGAMWRWSTSTSVNILEDLEQHPLRYIPCTRGRTPRQFFSVWHNYPDGCPLLSAVEFQIQTILPRSHWKNVPSVENPIDLESRVRIASQLVRSQL